MIRINVAMLYKPVTMRGRAGIAEIASIMVRETLGIKPTLKTRLMMAAYIVFGIRFILWWEGVKQ